MNYVFGDVVYVGLELDPFLKYPKCQARVAFGSRNSYRDAIANRFIQLKLREMDKRVRFCHKGKDKIGEINLR